MPLIDNLTSFVRLGLINPRLPVLARNLRKSGKTYLSYARLNSLANNFIMQCKFSNEPLQIAEFGVGRGGSAIFLAWLVNRFQGKLTLFDVFGRIPAPSEIDGEQAKSRYQTILTREGEDYYGNITDLLEIVKKDISAVCELGRVEMVQGKYEEILPNLADERQFNLVHIDCDWYESSSAVYRYLQTRLNINAIIQVDDYSKWDGSKRAFQEAAWLNQYRTHLVDGALVIETSAER